MVVCDVHGNVVDFEIQEGKGDLKSFVAGLDDRWEGEVEEKPIKVFDREGDGAGFFSSMVGKENPFVTWEKHSDNITTIASTPSTFSSLSESKMGPRVSGYSQMNELIRDLRKIYLRVSQNNDPQYRSVGFIDNRLFDTV